MLSTVPAAAAVRLQSVCYLALQLDYFHYLPPHYSIMAAAGGDGVVRGGDKQVALYDALVTAFRDKRPSRVYHCLLSRYDYLHSCYTSTRCMI